MVRKLAYLLVILAVLTAVGELCGLLLPTLSWPFTVSREMSMLNIVCTDQNNGGFLTPQGKFLWFGWVCVLVMGGLGFWLMLKGPRRFHPTPITRRRIQRFKSISRGYVSLLILLVLTLLACMDNAWWAKRALLVRSGRILVLSGHDAQSIPRVLHLARPEILRMRKPTTEN